MKAHPNFDTTLRILFKMNKSNIPRCLSDKKMLFRVIECVLSVKRHVTVQINFQAIYKIQLETMYTIKRGVVGLA